MSDTPLDKLFLQVQKAIHRCHECPLGADPYVKHITFKGSPGAKVWIIGECPGKIEEVQGKPFVGPAGEILDKMIKGLGFKEKDFFISNCVKCRSRALKGSGKENVPPTTEIIQTCRKHIVNELKTLQPEIVCLLGGSAIKAFLGKEDIKVSDYVGKAQKITGPHGKDVLIYCMYHPSYLLHSKKKGEETYQKIRLEMWEHAKMFKQIIKGEKNE